MCQKKKRKACGGFLQSGSQTVTLSTRKIVILCTFVFFIIVFLFPPPPQSIQFNESSSLFQNVGRGPGSLSASVTLYCVFIAANNCHNMWAYLAVLSIMCSFSRWRLSHSERELFPNRNAVGGLTLDIWEISEHGIESKSFPPFISASG